MPTRTRAILLALAVGLLAIPGVAHGQARTLGSPLTAPPANLDCNTRFYFAGSSSGDYVPGPSNTPDCTFRQQGIFGVPNDPRTGYVPFDGHITRVDVRSGPNPGLIRFVIGRQLTQSGQGAGTACCYFVTETQPVRPRPNAITTFRTNLPVERHADPRTDIVTADWIGVSGVSNTGSLPIASTGDHNAFRYTERGSPNIGDYYPRLGAVPNDRDGSGRYEEGLAGFEVLMRWTICPEGQACGGGGGGGPGAGGGTAGPDNLRGSQIADFLCGLAGADTIRGLGGADTLFGDLCNRRNKLPKAAKGDGNDRLFGGPGPDKLYGAGRNDLLKGQGGNDKLFGGKGNDRLFGGKGKNSYSGGAGKDRINARNRKRETVNCGSGKDRATVDKRDRVRKCEKVKRARK